jgi:hypothetical protein
VRSDTEPVQVYDGVRHHPVAACLVQHARSAFDDGDVEPGPCAVQRCGQARPQQRDPSTTTAT